MISEELLKQFDTYTILGKDHEVLWRAQKGPQQKLFDVTLAAVDSAQEILIGGSRGGGKTSAGIAWMTIHMTNPRFKGLVLRKTAESLKEWCDEAWRLYKQLGFTREGRPYTFVSPAGAKIYTGHFKDERSLEDYKGHEYHFILVEEATQIGREELYEQLLGSNRSSVPGITPRILLTTNPDGPGSTWVKQRFVKVLSGGRLIPAGQRFVGHDKRIKVFIPARIWDNKILMENDPGYLQYLEGIENDALKAAWLHGDWDCLDGSFFPEFRPNGPRPGEPEWANHVVPAHELAPWAHRWAALDWGFAHHSAGYWAALNPADRRTHVYREMVVRNMTAEDLGSEFARRSMPDLEALEDQSITLYLSHDAFANRNGGKTIAEQVRMGIERIIGPGSCYLLAKTEAERRLGEHDKAGAAEMFAERMDEQFKNARIIIKRSSSDRAAAASVAREYLKWKKVVETVEPDMNYARSLMGLPNGYQKYMAYMEKFSSQQELPPVPRVLIHDCCRVLIDNIPQLRPDPNNLETVKKFNGDASRVGDDPWDGFSYLLMGGREQQNAVPYKEFMAREVARHVGASSDINLKIQVAMQAEAKFKRKAGGSVIETLPRESMGARWHN